MVRTRLYKTGYLTTVQRAISDRLGRIAYLMESFCICRSIYIDGHADDLMHEIQRAATEVV